MAKPLKLMEIIENLEMLADWLLVKCPEESFKLVVAGGAALALQGFKNQTIDIDLFSPRVLPDPILKGVEHIGRIKKLGPEWLNTQLAVMLDKAVGREKLPGYFKDISSIIYIADNLEVNIIGRQAMISLKIYAATPSDSKHTSDIIIMSPDKKEILESIRFVMSIDDTEPRKDDLRIVLRTLGFDFDEIYKSI